MNKLMKYTAIHHNPPTFTKRKDEMVIGKLINTFWSRVCSSSFTPEEMLEDFRLSLSVNHFRLPWIK
jgi:hypothetical protein